jgi:molecular chaperone DnaK
VPKIEVTFDIDHNGILHVSAKDLGTGKEQKVRIEASSGLSAAEVEKMRKEAEAHAEEDRRKRELIDARNQADQLVYQVEKLLKDNADKLSEGDRAPVQAAIARVKDAMSQDDLQTIRRAIGDLQAASQAMAQHMQGREPVGAGARTSSGDGPHGAGHGPHGAGQGQDDVIDAEFEVKK